MNPNGQPYTPNTGLTPQGQQVATGQPNATNTVAPQPMPQGVNPNDPGLDQAASTSMGQLASMQTPQNRQAYVQNSNLPAMQQNYDQIAQQLYEYDKNVASQNYNVNPGTPSDASSFGSLVPGSDLGMTPDSINGMDKFSFTNPGYAVSTQTSQKNNISDLLGLLNSSLSKEFRSREGTYASTVQSQKDVVGFIKDLMGQRNDLAMKQAELAIQQVGINQNRLDKVQSRADQLVNSLRTGEMSWGDAWSSLKSFADKIGANVNPQDVDQMLGGKFDASDPTGAIGKTTGWAKPGAYQDYNAQKKLSSGTAFNNQEMQQLSARSQTMQLAQQAIDLLKAHPNATGATVGNVYNAMAEHGLQGVIPDPNIRDLAGILIKLKATGDKNLIGSGRLTAQLINMLSPSQANLNLSAADNIKKLQQLIDFGKQDFQETAKSKGADPTEVPYYSDVAGLGTPSQTDNSNTTRMMGPDGKVWNIPNDKVQAAMQRGAKVAQ